jgi:isopentenyldiphosphate isomerase
MPRTLEKQQPSLVPDADIEVLDEGGRPLLVMPQTQVLRQKLRHHTVLVCLRNANGHVFLYKSEEQEGIWLPAIHGRVVAGESRHDAAMRLLKNVFGISRVAVSDVARFRQPAADSAGNVDVTLFLTAKTSAVPRFREQDAPDGIFVDREELRAVMRDYPHMVTPFWNLALPYFISG